MEQKIVNYLDLLTKIKDNNLEKLRYKKNDIVILNKDININNLIFKKNTKCKIVYVDKLFRCYDIEINDITITDVNDTYFI